MLAASFQDCVLIDVAVAAPCPSIEVVFLDTQYHFAETLWYVDRVRERYDLNLTVMEPLVAPDDLWQTDPDECCAMRKVEPLARALAGKQAWMTGLRRVETPTRAKSPIVHLDVGRGIVKVNPLAPWTDADIAGVQARPRPARAPARRRRAIRRSAAGRAPDPSPTATTPVPAAGPGSGKMECGLHGWPEILDLIDRAAETNRMRADPSHLDALEAESIHLLREVAAEFERPVLLFSGGKDSVVMLHVADEGVLARAAAVPGHARRHRPQLPRGHRVPRLVGRAARRQPRRRVGAGVDRQRAASSRTPARARRATACRPRRCSTRSRSTASTR